MKIINWSKSLFIFISIAQILGFSQFLPVSVDFRLWLQLGTFVLLALLGIVAFGDLFNHHFRKICKKPFRFLAFIILLFLLDIVLTSMGALLANILYEVFDLTEGTSNSPGLSYLMTIVPVPLLVICIGILAPIAEELFYRVWLFSYLKGKLPLALAIILQGVLFGLAHMPNNHFNMAEILAAIPHIIGGIFYASIYLKTDNIYYPVMLHCLNNLSLSYS